MTNSNLPPEHLTYLQQRPFAFGCSTEVFPFEELKALADYGNLLEALATGRIQPVTQEQLHFLVVDREEANPETVCERAWIRLKGRRDFEKEQERAAPPPPPEDYGIIEWDKERCWW